jgi:hypothetical protein
MPKKFYELLCVNCNSRIGWTGEFNTKGVNYCDSCKEIEDTENNEE